MLDIQFKTKQKKTGNSDVETCKKKKVTHTYLQMVGLFLEFGQFFQDGSRRLCSQHRERPKEFYNVLKIR
jgi:hypothetical protein